MSKGGGYRYTITLLFWWFAIINLSGDIEFFGAYVTKHECRVIHDLYEKLNSDKYKITKCLEGMES